MIRAQIRKIQTGVLVLVVDNDLETQTCLSQSIRDLGHNCQIAISAEAALSHIQNTFPDVVLMDLLLPDSDARHLIQSVKRNAPQAHIVVMIRPGSAASIRESLSWGASDFLEKPVDELRLACLMSHLQTRISPREISEQIAAGLPEVFFNNDDAAYRLAKCRFQKALDMHIPVLIEGAPGTGKSTLARHFSGTVTPTQTLLQWDAATDDFGLFTHSPALQSEASLGRKYTILLKHVEAASLATQKAMAAFIKSSPHSFIATTRGRLLDHAKNGSVDAALYNVLSPLPVWLAPLHERPNAHKILSHQFLVQANACFGTGIQQLQHAAPQGQATGYADNLSGLKRAVFKTVADHSSPVTPAIIQPRQSAASNGLISPNETEAAHQPVTLQKNYAMAPLLDQNGQLRTLKALERDALLFAYEHKNARVGQIAKALKLGRTTLYRKLLELGLVSGTSAKNPQQDDSVMPANHLDHHAAVENTAKYAA